jgi:hypothetical protein
MLHLTRFVRSLALMACSLVLLTTVQAGESGNDGSQALEGKLRSMGDAYRTASGKYRTSRRSLTRSTALTATFPAPTSGLVISITGAAHAVSVERFRTLEMTVSLDNVGAAYPYEPDPTYGGLDLSGVFTAPSGGTWPVNGYYDGSQWKVRYAPSESGAWSYLLTARDPSGSATFAGSFQCLATNANRGWLRIDRTGLRFSADNGWFWGIGHNTGWLAAVETPTMEVMSANGMDLLSFWMATPWAEPGWGDGWDARAPIENAVTGIGNYHQPTCQYIDGLVAHAESTGIRLVPSLWSHGQVRIPGQPWSDGWWSNNAYSDVGVCPAGPTDFFKLTASTGGDSLAWRYQKSFYRYVLARWGSSASIAAWVGMVEIDGTMAGTAGTAWAGAVKNFFVSHDPYRRNATGRYPLAVTKVDNTSYDPGTDLRSTDSYAQKGDNTKIAAYVQTQVQNMRASGKPSFLAEFGGDVNPPPLPGATQPTHLHNGLWASLGSGSAMSSILWTDEGDYPQVRPDTAVGSAMLTHYAWLKSFVQSVGYVGDASLVKLSPTYTSSGLVAYGMRSSPVFDRGYVWTRANSGNIPKTTMKVSGVVRGSYNVTWFNAWSGATISTATIAAKTSGGTNTLSIPMPAVSAPDVAMRFAQVGVTSVAVVAAPAAAADSAVSPTGSGIRPPSPGRDCGLGSGVGALVMALLLAVRCHLRRR